MIEKNKEYRWWENAYETKAKPEEYQRQTDVQPTLRYTHNQQKLTPTDVFLHAMKYGSFDETEERKYEWK